MAFLRLWLAVLPFLVSFLSHVANIFFKLLTVLFYSLPLLFPLGPSFLRASISVIHILLAVPSGLGC